MNLTKLTTLVLLLAPTAAFAQEATPETCAPNETTDDHRLLRQLTLDLYGRIPSYEELQAFEGVDDALVEEMLTSEEFFATVRRYHRKLVWGSLDGITDLAASRRRLRRTGDRWHLPNARRTYRGNNTVSCLNQLQTEFDAEGRPIPIQTLTTAPGGGTCDGGECRREGYVMVRPYWDPDVEIKVCAYDAQALPTSANGNTCADSANTHRDCGCGPQMRYCIPRGGQYNGVYTRMLDALADEPARIFEWVAREGRSYFEAFTTERTFVNGATSHFYRFAKGAPSLENNAAVVYETQMGDVPAVDFASDEWVPVDRGEVHAGALTTFGYLQRFASNRSRANRFYTAFRCQPFLPSAEGLPEEPEDDPHPNLRERAGCNSCHDTLEPAAAHWGRWRGPVQYGYLSPAVFDLAEPRSDCSACDSTRADGAPRCSAFCNTYFVTKDNAHQLTMGDFAGLPTTVAYLEGPERSNIDLGPAALVDEESEQELVASCAVRTMGEHLLGRELTEEELIEWAPAQTAAFAESGHDFTALVRSIVSSDRYRTNR